MTIGLLCHLSANMFFCLICALFNEFKHIVHKKDMNMKLCMSYKKQVNSSLLTTLRQSTYPYYVRFNHKGLKNPKIILHDCYNPSYVCSV